jgi:hypothetical protein
MRKKLGATLFAAFLFFPGSTVFAHTPLMSCFDNGDGTITCEGGFSDGSSAAGVAMRVVNAAGEAMTQGKMNEDSEFTFNKPSGDYTAIFDAGEGHVVEVPGSEIFE